MAERTVFSFRVPDEDADRFEALRAAQDRDRSDMARRVFSAGLRALSGLPSQQPVNAPHPYVPREGNALRCGTCGLAKGQHR